MKKENVFITIGFVVIIIVAVIGYTQQAVYRQPPQVEIQQPEVPGQGEKVEVLGRWWDDHLDVGRMLFKTKEDRYYHTLFDKNGETGKYTPLILKELNSELRYYFDDNNVSGEYLTISSINFLELYDSIGLIKRLKNSR